MRSIAEFIPAKARAVIYTVLGALNLLEAVWDVIPQPLEGKLLQTLSILGFGLAAANAATPNGPLPPPPASGGGVAPNFPDEFA